MRLLSIIFLLLLISCSKYTKLDGTYFSTQQDCFIIDDKDGVIENKRDYIEDNLVLKQKNTKLKFRSRSYGLMRRIFKRNISKYTFKILYKTEDSFMVSPKSKLARKYFKNRDSILFKTRYQFADQANYFTKIIYHSSHCFGCCKDLYLELDYSGNLKVTDNGSGKRGCTDSVLNDNYFGKVSYDDLERLKNILKYSQLKTLEWPKERNCFDAPDITLILYQNDKRYYFKENQPCIPIVSWQLTNFLGRLFRYSTLQKIDTTWKYEQ
ncbi:hypothetical protein [Ferruginibacter sp. SUN106]|uniref:hypothetical protein n=1 Tax=Ferruginibacter sp. SUN106 TaxID=2978348 RepID=UPI003D363B39